jgi:WD40 repeat protein
MRNLNWILLIILAGLLAFGNISCSLIAVNNSPLTQATQGSEGPTNATPVRPLFAPQTNTVIKSVNASSLAPSEGVTFPGAKGFTWLSNGQGAALTAQEDVLVLPGPQAEPFTQSNSTVVTQTITSPTPSLLISASKAAIIAWVSDGVTINSLDVSSISGNPVVLRSESPVTGLALDPSGEKLAYINFKGTAVVQQLDNTGTAQSWEFPTWLVNLSFSPDSSQLSGVDLENFSLYFLDARTGAVLDKLEWLESATPALYGVYLSPDWRQAAWVAQNAVQIMSVKDGSLGPMLLHQDVVKSVSWSPDGRLMATAAAALINDKLEPVVMIWDASNGEILNTIVQQVAIQNIAFSPDGRQLAVLDSNGNLQTWSVKP